MICLHAWLRSCYWSLKKQLVVTMSTTEAKFIVVARACQGDWLRGILDRIGMEPQQLIVTIVLPLNCQEIQTCMIEVNT